MRLPIFRTLPMALLVFAATSLVASDPAASQRGPIRAKDVAAAVQGFLDVEILHNEGLCRINDPVENVTLDLRLKEIYDGKLMKVRSGVYVTCATFEAADGTTYDVDFFVKGTTPRNLKVFDASIHAKSGLQRYAWVNDKGRFQVSVISSEMPMREELAH